MLQHDTLLKTYYYVVFDNCNYKQKILHSWRSSEVVKGEKYRMFGQLDRNVPKERLDVKPCVKFK